MMGVDAARREGTRRYIQSHERSLFYASRRLFSWHCIYVDDYLNVSNDVYCLGTVVYRSA